MVESDEIPHSGELLDRITRLEGENAELQRQLNELRSTVNAEVANTTDHIRYLYQRLEDYLWPLVHRVFPGFRETIAQGEAILKGEPPGPGVERQ